MPPLHDIAHLAHVELFTHKPEESLDFFVRYLGMTENGSAGDSVFLRAWDDYENTTIKLTAAPQPGVGRTNFRASSADALQRRGGAGEGAGPGRGGGAGGRDRGDRPGPGLGGRRPGLRPGLRLHRSGRARDGRLLRDGVVPADR